MKQHNCNPTCQICINLNKEPPYSGPSLPISILSQYELHYVRVDPQLGGIQDIGNVGWSNRHSNMDIEESGDHSIHKYINIPMKQQNIISEAEQCMNNLNKGSMQQSIQREGDSYLIREQYPSKVTPKKEQIRKQKHEDVKLDSSISNKNIKRLQTIGDIITNIETQIKKEYTKKKQKKVKSQQNQKHPSPLQNQNQNQKQVDKLQKQQQSCSNQNQSQSVKSEQSQSKCWNQEEQELFIQLINSYGTDFNMIKQHFPRKSKNQIKSKYKMIVNHKKKNVKRQHNNVSSKNLDHKQCQNLSSKSQLGCVGNAQLYQKQVNKEQANSWNKS